MNMSVPKLHPKRIAIVGAGPTCIYTLLSLLKGELPLEIVIFERAEEAGIGMPYSADRSNGLMLANIASIEIPPIINTYLEWLREQNVDYLASFGIDKHSLHERQFLPRILLGQYFREQYLMLLEIAADKGFDVSAYESCNVTDIEASTQGVTIWAMDKKVSSLFDLVVIATGHVWPDKEKTTQSYFPSPWSGMLEANIAACKVGIMGTSLSAIDAAMAVAAQHGTFVESDEDTLNFERAASSSDLTITLMSRSGILPEADFFFPIPYEPLEIATEAAIAREIAAGSDGLLDRVYDLAAQEIQLADPAWSHRVSLATQNVDTFADAYFMDRGRYDPFRWAEYNLAEVERNKRQKQTVAWRYAILRLHEAVQDIVAHLDGTDRERFSSGLAKVFIDNYAAVPPESIRRLLALRASGVISLLTLGHDYKLELPGRGAIIHLNNADHRFDVFIDARGQRPLKTKDIPFPRLREQLITHDDEFPDVGDDYTLQAPDVVRGRVAFAALPYLMHDQPFVQGITASAEMGSAIARAATRSAQRTRRRLMIDLDLLS